MMWPKEGRERVRLLLAHGLHLVGHALDSVSLAAG